ncbi:ATP-binding protein [Streptomyces sp. NPDC093085]|uniref:ATP-binding protein n=1 Tax=Streptomyces sp. NPDC093085 TaxID=3155068 RepID=UPI0034312AC0
MKQSAAKTIGAAALGAAFAAAAASTASAAPALPDTGAALDVVGSVSKTLPVEQLASTLPAPLPEAAKGAAGAVDTVEFTAPYALDAVGKANPVQNLLGGLPVNGLANGGTTLNGLPLGG